MADKKWMKFRLLHGKHIQTDRDGIERMYSAPGQGDMNRVCIIESHTDLCSLNGYGMQPKFERIADHSDSPHLMHGLSTIDMHKMPEVQPSQPIEQVPIPPQETGINPIPSGGDDEDEEEKLAEGSFPSIKGAAPVSTKADFAQQLNVLTIAELKTVAAEEEIAIKSNMSRDDIIKAVLASF